MNKLIYGFIAVAVIIIAGVGAYFIVGRDTAETSETVVEEMVSEQSDSQRASSEVVTESMSLTDIINEQKNQLCTFTDSETKGVGTVFIGDRDFRGDFQTDINDKASVTHMIVLDTTDVYVWMEGETQGFKTSMSGLTDLSEFGEETTAFNINKAVDYECYPWTLDNSQFELPQAVEFRDMSSMLENASEYMNQ